MNYQTWYERISASFRTEGAIRALNLLDRFLVYAFAVVYIGLLVFLAIQHDPHLLKAFLVPALTFALVSGARLLINRPRPYEAYSIRPLIHKDTQGKSLPSRHMASAVVIACTFFWISPMPGIALFVACAFIAFTRIVGGVHYPTDIIAAIAISLILAAIGYIALP